MKLKRIISALIVFTMVMACAVCSVNAAGTYQTMTTYNVGTGEITVNAKLAGAAEGSMVSYIIYGDEDEETADAVSESNIVHIDQATVGAGGAATFDAVTTDFADFKNRHVQFVSNEEVLTAWATGSKTTRAGSVETITDMQTSVVFVNQQANSLAPVYYYIADGVPVGLGNVSGNINTGSNWGTDADGNENYIPTKSAVIDLKVADAIMVDTGTSDKRDSYTKIYFQKYAGSYSGQTNGTVTGTTIYQTGDSQDEDKVRDENYKNLLVGGRYKEVVSDGNFAGLTLTGGDLIGFYEINEPGYKDGREAYLTNANTVLYMTITADPIIGTYTNNNGTFDAVTFLCSPASAVYDYEEFGLNIYRYEKVENSADAELELIASCPSAVDGRFGIQIFDGLDDGIDDLDSEVYDFEAIPYVVIDDEKVELSVYGDTYVSDPEKAGGNYGSSYYYLRKHDTVKDIIDVE